MFSLILATILIFSGNAPHRIPLRPRAPHRIGAPMLYPTNKATAPQLIPS